MNKEELHDYELLQGTFDYGRLKCLYNIGSYRNFLKRQLNRNTLYNKLKKQRRSL